MKQFSELGKDDMIYTSEPFHKIIPVYLIIRIFIFYLFEKITYYYSKKYSKTYARLSDKNKNTWTSKATSIFHAVLVTILCIPSTITDITNSHSDKDLAFGITKRRVDVMLWTISYLIYDLYMMISVNKNQLTLEMIIHHIVCVLAYVLGIYYNIGTVFMASFIINEFTTPFLHFRWYLSRMKKRETTLAFVNNLFFAITYFIIRGLWNTYILYDIVAGYIRYMDELRKCTVPMCVIMMMPLLALSHCILNWYWIYLIFLQVIHPPKPHQEDEYPINKQAEENNNTINENTPLFKYETEIENCDEDISGFASENNNTTTSNSNNNLEDDDDINKV